MTSIPQVQITARDYYVLTKGIPLNGAISAVAVFYYESKLNPGSQGYQTTETPGVLNPHGAYGIMSLNGPRQQDLLDFATTHSLPVENLETQLSFSLTDMANKYPNCWAAIRSQASYNAIIPILVDEYENPKNKPAEINGALAIAKALAALPPPQPAPSAPVPQVPSPQVPAPSLPRPAAPAALPPISATSAGRIAAQIDTLTAMRAARMAELAAADPEIAAYDAGLATFTKLGVVSAAIPTPPAIPGAAIPEASAQQEGSIITMPAIFTSILTNWATSALGTMAGSPSVIDVIQNPTNWKQDIPGIATVLLGLVAKDGWVTGGTKQAPVSK